MAGAPDPPLRLCLYVTGDSAGARRARENLNRLLERLPGAVEVEIVDVLEDPGRAETSGVLFTPTLSHDATTPPRRIVGDLHDTDRVLEFFGLTPREPDR